MSEEMSKEFGVNLWIFSSLFWQNNGQCLHQRNKFDAFYDNKWIVLLELKLKEVQSKTEAKKPITRTLGALDMDVNHDCNENHLGGGSSECDDDRKERELFMRSLKWCTAVYYILIPPTQNSNLIPSDFCIFSWGWWFIMCQILHKLYGFVELLRRTFLSPAGGTYSFTPIFNRPYCTPYCLSWVKRMRFVAIFLKVWDLTFSEVLCILLEFLLVSM